VKKLDFETLKQNIENLWIFGHYQVYGNTKVTSILFAFELHRRLQDKNITTYSLHPGTTASIS